MAESVTPAPTHTASTKKRVKADPGDIDKGYSRGHINAIEELAIAPKAPTDSYEQEYWDAAGNLTRIAGAFVNLYITPEALAAEFRAYIKTKPDLGTEFLIRGGAITEDDMIKSFGSTKDGRAILAKYATPSDIFVKSKTLQPYSVKDYYLEPEGIAKTKSGLTETLQSAKLFADKSGFGIFAALAGKL